MMLYESMHFQVNDHFNEHEFHSNSRITERRPSAPMVTNKSACFKPNPKNIARTNSYVVGQKLRESKWFDHDELKIFSSVVETGFIIQRKTDEEEPKAFGIVVWTTGYEKSKQPEHIHIYSLREHRGTLKMHHFTVEEFWPEGTLLKINNFSDKSETPHSEDVIKKQITSAEKTKMKWHNTEHFAYFCRYGQPETPRSKHRKCKGYQFWIVRGLCNVQADEERF
ncbi:uncharacterized protein [Onthophagus taurus]|uniref:uncharacterized protein isoform X2 n=1 Tax=Onthophagus taurus TaxID=166361 RepID=UPI000C2056EC|nr:uncharacterized protein LOC111429276 isoform X2 [Onthophagus taurus]